MDPSATTSTKWLGPDGPRPTWFDPMCPTPPREDTVEADFERRLRELERKTDLSGPDHKVCFVSCIGDDGAFERRHLWSIGVRRTEGVRAMPEEMEWMRMHGFKTEEEDAGPYGAVFQVIKNSLF